MAETHASTSPGGGVCYFELPAPDLDRAQAFYGEVFAWAFTPMGDDYVEVRAGALTGGLNPGLPIAEGGAVLVLEVEDIPATLQRIEAWGGLRLCEKTEIGEGMGFYAYFRDPFGNRLGVWSRA